MLYLKLYKPLTGLQTIILNKKLPLFITSKVNKRYKEFNNINDKYSIFSTKICFFTFKYKTQLNILHMSRHTLRTNLTFNKDHS